jgi:ABC-type uncharacterized transport system permease subunit
MRTIMVAAVLASALAGSSAFAPSTYTHHAWCLMLGSAQECGYDTLAACKAGKHNPTDRCVRNTAPMNH